MNSTEETVAISHQNESAFYAGMAIHERIMSNELRFTGEIDHVDLAAYHDDVRLYAARARFASKVALSVMGVTGKDQLYA